ncbi:hypothetical protein C7E23_01035 [Elizabethkingia anophelis]|nr:hypothetical protein C7E23_01035 [Elizabethkingia anophelis]
MSVCHKKNKLRFGLVYKQLNFREQIKWHNRYAIMKYIFFLGQKFLLSNLYGDTKKKFFIPLKMFIFAP